MAAITFQSDIKTHDVDLKKYTMFVGGINATEVGLNSYNILQTGYGRLFMISKPIFMTKDPEITEKLNKFKHIMEYGNLGVSGNSDLEMQFSSLSGGYVGKQVDVANVLVDNSREFSVKVYEFSGSPVREVIQYWLSGISDAQSGYGTYNMANRDIEIRQSNHTAEFIYVVTDKTGKEIEYACMFSECIPKSIRLGQFDYDSGQHELVTMEITFSCIRYISRYINKIAKSLLDRYNLLMSSLNFYTGIPSINSNDKTESGKYGSGSFYNPYTGKLQDKTNGQSDIKNSTIIANDRHGAYGNAYHFMTEYGGGETVDTLPQGETTVYIKEDGSYGQIGVRLH